GDDPGRAARRRWQAGRDHHLRRRRVPRVRAAAGPGRRLTRHQASLPAACAAARPAPRAMSSPVIVVSTCMTTMTHHTAPVVDQPTAAAQAEATARIRRRLRPLYAASWVLGINLWVPVEKLFLSQIGFTAATVGLLAATYAAAVPFLKIPS